MKRKPSLRARLTAIPPHRLMVLLDYDGTLTPIVRRPEEARLKASVRQTLSRLARSVPVVIVSGRALSDLQKRVGLPSVRYLAYHGLLYKEPGTAMHWMGQRPRRQEVREWVRALKGATEGIAGALIEDKGLTVALHDRLVRPADRARLRRRALRALAPWLANKKVALVDGKRVLEARLTGAWNKGTAVAELLRRPWARRLVPVYFGDDRTDFDAFRVVRNRGLAVRVGGRRGLAGENAWVSDPSRLDSLLDWLSARVARAEGVEKSVL